MANKNKNKIKMKNLILFTIFLNFCNCSTNKGFNFYEGHIYSKNKIPVKTLEVFEKDRPNNKTFTDDMGFFKLKKQKNSISTFLIVKNREVLIDSIQVVRTSGGEKINYYFVEGTKDTLFIDIK